MITLNLYYLIKPLIPRRVQLYIRRFIALNKRKIYKDIWPIAENCRKLPLNWHGWPSRKQFALILTHDVETANGYKKVQDLMQLEKQLGFRSSFYFVPERYAIAKADLMQIKKEGFEIGVHGLKHDGKLFKDHKTFMERAPQINRYLEDWEAVGFRAPSMLHNLEWIQALNIQYDASTFDIDPFEPQPEGVGTIFPFIVKSKTNHNFYVELPYTLPQDSTLFVILKEKSIDIWLNKLNWIAGNGGMALICTHPDYINFGRTPLKGDEYPASYYTDFLNYVLTHFKGQFWHVLPNELASFWQNNKNHFDSIS